MTSEQAPHEGQVVKIRDDAKAVLERVGRWVDRVRRAEIGGLVIEHALMAHISGREIKGFYCSLDISLIDRKVFSACWDLDDSDPWVEVNTFEAGDWPALLTAPATAA